MNTSNFNGGPLSAHLRHKMETAATLLSYQRAKSYHGYHSKIEEAVLEHVTFSCLCHLSQDAAELSTRGLKSMDNILPYLWNRDLH